MSLADALAPLSDVVQSLGRQAYAALLDQRGRMLLVSTALPHLALVPERLVMREALGQPFELLLDCLSCSANFELKLLVGEQMSVRLLQPSGVYRPWHGYVTQAMQMGSDGGLARYRLVMSPWLSFLGLQRDSRMFQDQSAQQIVEAVFSAYPQAHYRFELSEPLPTRSLCCQYRESDLAFVARLLAEEGLIYRFEHLDAEASADADAAGHARHVLVVGDRLSTPASLGVLRFTSQHPTAQVLGQQDAVTAFTARRQLQPNAVTLAAWDYKRVAGVSAQDSSTLDQGELPTLEIYDGSGAYRYADTAQAERAAGLALAALELGVKRFEGQGSVRALGAGFVFSLVDHPLYGANTTALDHPAAALSSRQRDDNEFLVLAVEHHASNNLGSEAARLLRHSELERGTYKNHFHAVLAAAAPVPRFIRKPTAPGAQTALVVGVAGDPITTERDHRVKLQFHWQRGTRPNPGGLIPDGSDASSAPTRAPGDDGSGTWVRVALPAAGANWGAALVPRIGTEVAVAFIEGDIDRPVIVGGFYNGVDLPPFSAGADSGVNHPGVISGAHTQGLDGGGFNQWVMDDASGQLRTRLHSASSDGVAAELGLGHLIQQAAGSAQRGAWRGAGFEAGTVGWASLRAGRGMLISTTTRAGSYGSAQGGQMDSQEAAAQLQGAQSLGRKLGAAAASAGAQDLGTHGAGRALDKMLEAIDPKQDGKHPASVNGQPAQLAESDGRTLQDPTPAYAQPLIVLDTPSAAILATPAQISAYAGGSFSAVSQGDLHQTAAHTYASVSGQTTSLYTHQGGMKVYAANGPLSLQAHTDELQIWADQAVTVISVNDEVRVGAQTRIELVAGQSSIVLDGGNITLTMPGNFTVKGGAKAFLGGGSQPPNLVPLPSSTVYSERFQLKDRKTGQVKANERYWLTANGQTVEGRTDDQGWTHSAFTDGPQPIVLEIEQDGLELEA